VPILFDTGALELLRRRHRHAEKLAIDFFPPVICTAVLGEFLYGQLLAEVSSRSLLDVQEFLGAFEIERPDSSTALIYARLRSDQKRRGIVLPDPDFWIAAHAVQANWPLASTDTDFRNFDEVRLFLLSS
jgi:predicted nucleic acid-binding protein